MNRIRNERGIALAVAIFALVVIGGLVSAAFFVGVQEQRVGRNTVKLQQAFSAADGGAQAAVNVWPDSVALFNKMVVGTTRDLGRGSMASSAGWYRASIKRLNDQLFIVTSEGFSQDSSARQRVAIMLRLRPIELNVNAALKSRGTLKLGGSSFIDGIDHAPTGWSCPPLLDTIPGIRLPGGDSANIQYSGCSSMSCLSGTPKIKSDNTITDSTLSHFGDAAFADLRGLANKFPPAGTTTGVDPTLSGLSCNTADIKNWGDPLNPVGACGDYYPVIWIDGDASINGNHGQGILIVNGDLDVQGGFEFYGPVIVRGSLKTSGTGGHFNGGVIARNVDLEQETILGNAVINFSSCALSKALNGSAAGSAMRERGWVNVY